MGRVRNSPFGARSSISSHGRRDLIDDFNSAPEEEKPEIQDMLGMNTKNYVDSNNAILKINKTLSQPVNSQLYNSKKNEIHRWQNQVKTVLDENR